MITLLYPLYLQLVAVSVSTEINLQWKLYAKMVGKATVIGSQSYILTYARQIFPVNSGW